jgi:hypothetical protein
MKSGTPTQTMSTEKKQRPCTCGRVFRHMCDTLGADMNSPECRAMRAHVTQCPNCTAYLASLRKTVQLYESYPSPRLSAKAKAELLRSFKAQKKK